NKDQASTLQKKASSKAWSKESSKDGVNVVDVEGGSDADRVAVVEGGVAALHGQRSVKPSQEQ
ncbi:MAG: hypothetical protein LQ340_007279, partial [Diploschistes diacapsis]